MTIMHMDAMPASGNAVQLYLGAGNAYSGLIYTYATGVAGFRFDNNTYVYALNNGGSQQLQLGGDQWITPRTGITAGDYEIRWHETSVFSTLLNVSAQPSTGWDEDTWLDLSTDRQILYSGNGAQPYGYPQEYIQPETLGATITLRIELRFGDGTPDPRNTLTSTIDGNAYAALGLFYTIQIGTPF